MRLDFGSIIDFLCVTLFELLDAVARKLLSNRVLNKVTHFFLNKSRNFSRMPEHVAPYFEAKPKLIKALPMIHSTVRYQTGKRNEQHFEQNHSDEINTENVSRDSVDIDNP